VASASATKRGTSGFASFCRQPIATTLGSLPALPLALYLLWTQGRIAPRAAAGKAYFVFMIIGAITVFPIAHSGVSMALGALTLLLLLVGFGVRLRPTASRAALYVETIALSLTVFLLLLPTVTEVLRRLPPGHPIVTDLASPVLRTAHLALVSGLIVGLILQVRSLRRGVVAARTSRSPARGAA
jgi:hypothetical protein